MNLKHLLISAATALALTQTAIAGPISGLFNTGAGFSTNAQDTHYALTVQQGNTVAGAYGYVADNAGYPDGSPWIGNSSTASKWLTPFADEAASFDPTVNGVYRWRLSFNLTGFDLATASFSGRWAADNNGRVLLNGVQIGTANSFSSWSSFTASTGFVSGINTLDFVVTNLFQSTGNPTGVRVEFVNSAANAVPEPESLALLGIGLLALARRRTR